MKENNIVKMNKLFKEYLTKEDLEFITKEIAKNCLNIKKGLAAFMTIHHAVNLQEKCLINLFGETKYKNFHHILVELTFDLLEQITGKKIDIIELSNNIKKENDTIH